MHRLASLVFGVALAGLALIGVSTAETTATPLRVAVYDVPPYGYAAANGEIDGVSVDLWRRVGSIPR